MEVTGMLYILPTIVLQVEAYLYNETINKTILSFWGVLWWSNMGTDFRNVELL